jgi:hypothetical protein
MKVAMVAAHCISIAKTKLPRPNMLVRQLCPLAPDGVEIIRRDQPIPAG